MVNRFSKKGDEISFNNNPYKHRHLPFDAIDRTYYRYGISEIEGFIENTIHIYMTFHLKDMS